MKKLLFIIICIIAITPNVYGQQTPPFVFTDGTVAQAAQVNANFALFASALNRTGGVMSGVLSTLNVVPTTTNTYDLGSTSLFYRTAHLRTSAILGQTTANYTLTWANPAAARAISIADPGGTDVFTFNAATQTLTNKTLTSPVLSGNITGTYTLVSPTLSGTVLGTYTLGGTPTISASGLTGTITSSVQDNITRLGTISTALLLTNSLTVNNTSSLRTILAQSDNAWDIGAVATRFANVYATTFTGNLTGNVTGNVSGTAPAGTLTGATLAAGVTGSSLTSVGTLTGGATGAGFTVALSTSTITGSLADARLSSNVALENISNVFDADQSITRSTAGLRSLIVANSAAGAASFAGYLLGNDANPTSAGALYAMSSTNTFGGVYGSGNNIVLVSDLANGLVLAARESTGVIKMFVNGSTESAELGLYVPSYTMMRFLLNSRAFGSGGFTGANVTAGANTSGSGAAGTINLKAKNDGNMILWVDASATPGMLRISTSAPEEDGTPSDTSGTIVGTQTSTLDTKHLIAPFTDTRHALDVVAGAPLWRFRYRGTAYGGSEFVGAMSTTTPEVMMDPSPEHPEGRSFSPVSAFGYSSAAIAELKKQIEQLRDPFKRLFPIPEVR